MTGELEFDPLQNVLPAFITPIGRFRVPGHASLDAALSPAILERAEKQRSPDGNSSENWRSSEDMLNWPQPEVAQLARQVSSAMKHMILLARDGEKYTGKVRLTAWAGLHESGSDWPLQHQPGRHWTGLYVVEAPRELDGEGAFQFKFQDPRGPATNMFPHPGADGMSGLLSLKPEAGLLLVFPAWLAWGIQVLRSDGRLMVVGFGARLGGPGDWDSPVAFA